MIVLDASVLANAVGDDGSDGARARQALRGEDVAAPALVDVEVMAVLRKRWLAGDVDDDRFDAAMHDLRDLAVERHTMQPLLPRMYEHRFNLTAYDAAYVALAEAFECPLLTSDRRLARAPGLRCDVTLVEMIPPR